MHHSEEKSIVDIGEIVENLDMEEKILFSRIYRYYVRKGMLRLTKEMKGWAEERFGNCEEQKIVRITNKITLESTLFNELRAKRPIEGKETKVDIESECKFFCDPLRMTPEDSFGRISGEYCITASNIAKYDYLHGLVIFNEHTPYVDDQEKIRDYFYVAREWFKAAYNTQRDAKYPLILWNCMWRAGASIVHGHMQLLLSHEPYGKYELYKRICENYKKDYGRDYFLDLVSVHRALGLGIGYADSFIMSYLTPIKEKEVFIVSESLEYLPEIISKILNLYFDLKVQSFNLVVFLPPIDEKSEIPYITRIVDRGPLDVKTSDIGGMELYAGTSVVYTDPFKFAEKLKKIFT